MKVSPKKRIYLDFASTTPCDPKVLKAMLPFLGGSFANPASLYLEGVEMKKKIKDARKVCADILFAHQDEIIFTGSGTESNNLAILGIHTRLVEEGVKKLHYVTSTIEHASVLEVFKELERRGASVTYVAPNEMGIINPSEIKKALLPHTALVSIMYSNNEIGTIQDIREIAKVVRHFRKTKVRPFPSQSSSSRSDLGLPFLHTDASQSANYLNLNVEQLGVDLMTLDGSKIYGPKGVGMLYKKRRVFISPIIFGGGQEQGLRSGTENVAGIIGFTTALSMVQSDKAKESKRLVVLRDWLIKNILATFPESILNGHKVERLPNNVNICFPNLDAEFAVLQLDARGISCSSVTSCKNLTLDSSSYVIEAIRQKREENCAKSSLRISLGRSTSKQDLTVLLKALKEVMK